MAWADEVRFETPEQIDIELEVAGLGSRFMAKMLDLLVQSLLFVVTLILILLIVGVLGEFPAIRQMGSYVMIILAAGIYLFVIGWNVYYEVRHNGQTPGKRWTGIRVVRETGGPVDFRSSAIRNLLAIADFIPVVFLLGSFLVVVTKRAQRLGDMAAATLVIRERQNHPGGEPIGRVEALADDALRFLDDQLKRCTPDDRRVLREFFRRFPKLDEHAREMLAEKLTRQFAHRLQVPNDVEETEPVTFLASLYRDLQTFSHYDT